MPESVRKTAPDRPARADPPVDVACNYCGGREASLEKLERGFRVVRCVACEHVYVTPRPSLEALVADYQDYLPDDPAGVEGWRRMMEPCERAAAELVDARSPKRGRILDVGCGFGFFLARMRERGRDARGLELSGTGRRFARERLGLDVRPALLEEEPYPPASFAVVTAFYVIEHVTDPLDFLRRARALLEPGGLLLLRYPDSRPVARLLARLGLDSIPIYDAPFHLSAFSPGSIARFLDRAGLVRIEHTIGGFTRPPRAIERLISTWCGGAAGLLERATLGRVLLPGVSKCVLARRPGT